MNDDPRTEADRRSSLVIDGLHAWYGESHALRGLSLEVRPGEVVTLLGRNGAGKTTTLRCIMGLMRKATGSVRYGSRELLRLRPYEVARLGIAYCPEDRGIFSSLTVEENLVLPPVVAAGGLGMDEIHAKFPNLRESPKRQGTKLSGGEQQMLALARVLRTGARFLLLDEPTEGLAPVIVQAIANVTLQLKQAGFTILLVEQNFRFASKMADRHYVMENGMIVDGIDGSQLRQNESRIKKYLAV